MKKLLVLAGLFALVGCSKEPAIVGVGDPSELKLDAKTIATVIDGQQNQTKTTSTMRQTDFGLYVLTTAGGTTTDFATTPWKNQEFLSDGTGAVTGSSIVLRTGTTYDFYAYAPRNATLTDINAIPVAHGDDLLWVRKQNVTATSGTTAVNLEFEHVGAQIYFEVTGMQADLAKIEVAGFYPSGTYDLETGTVTTSQSATTTIIREITQDLADATYNVIVPTGQTFNLAVTVTNTDMNRGYTGSVTDKVLTRGTAYKFQITVDTDVDGVLFADLTVEDWIEEAVSEIPVQ